MVPNEHSKGVYIRLLHSIYIHTAHFKQHECRPGAACTGIHQSWELCRETRINKSGWPEWWAKSKELADLQDGSWRVWGGWGEGTDGSSGLIPLASNNIFQVSTNGFKNYVSITLLEGRFREFTTKDGREGKSKLTLGSQVYFDATSYRLVLIPV